MTSIVMKGVAHSYEKFKVASSDYALKQIDTVWDSGGAYALLGPSGCGKTTLLNILSGLLVPSEGKVFYNDLDVTGLTPEKRNIAQVFQFPVLYDTMSVYDNLAFPLRNRKLPGKKVDSRVREVAEILELTNDLGKKASGLSADAKQKISLGRGLVREDVAAILFDEPLTVIDPHMKWLLRRKLKEIHQKTGITFIYVTHDQVEAMTFADRVVVMKDGEILQTGTPQELFEYPAHTFVGYFIGSPGMNFLPVDMDGDCAIFKGHKFALEKAITSTGKKDGSENWKIGIRPMHVALHNKPVNDSKLQSVPVEVLSVQDQGSHRLVQVTLSGTRVSVRVPEREPVPIDNCHMTFPSKWVRLYKDERLFTS